MLPNPSATSSSEVFLAGCPPQPETVATSKAEPMRAPSANVRFMSLTIRRKRQIGHTLVRAARSETRSND